jgi:glutamate N-acetyltransferase/amino-acid N-acetyltransferase
MPVGLQEPANILSVPGVRLASVAAGIRYRGRDDLVLIDCGEQASVAAVFTRNAFCAAPVSVARQHLQGSQVRYLLINAGNANAGTGAPGLAAASESCRMVADVTRVAPEQVLPYSTGVIGEQLPVARIEAQLPALVNDLAADRWMDVARAIMTTDTVAKACSRRLTLQGQSITITGVSKGAGMICPNMATMLAFVATDAVISGDVLQDCLNRSVAKSFNRITVDGDTSTNDACTLVASGASGVAIESEVELAAFQRELDAVCLHLAQSIIRDAEGVTKFITIAVEGATDEAEAAAVAYTVAHSPLVKTALFASDPNWGRILAAVGRAPIAALDLSRVAIYLQDCCVISAGEPDADYTEEQGKAVFEQDEIEISIHLGRGAVATKVWTSDLSHDYVSINADYRS